MPVTRSASIFRPTHTPSDPTRLYARPSIEQIEPATRIHTTPSFGPRSVRFMPWSRIASLWGRARASSSGVSHRHGALRGGPAWYRVLKPLANTYARPGHSECRSHRTEQGCLPTFQCFSGAVTPTIQVART